MKELKRKALSLLMSVCEERERMNKELFNLQMDANTRSSHPQFNLKELTDD